MPRPIHTVETWVFDLDNTLYPASCRLFDQVSARIGEFIARHLGVGIEEARRLQREYFRRHGTSLRGMMLEHGMLPDAFLDYVHDVDLSVIPPNEALGAAIAALPGRKIIYTNGSERHAARILAHLGLDPHFEGVHDIVAAGFLPKPDPSGYAALLRRFDVDPRGAAMVEDMVKNLAPAAALGMTTVWVREEAHQMPWASEGIETADFVHHVVDDLVAFLVTAGVAHDEALPVDMDAPAAAVSPATRKAER